MAADPHVTSHAPSEKTDLNNIPLQHMNVQRLATKLTNNIESLNKLDRGVTPSSFQGSSMPNSTANQSQTKSFLNDDMFRTFNSGMHKDKVRKITQTMLADTENITQSCLKSDSRYLRTMKETIQEQLARKNQAKEVQPKNEKVTLIVMDKRGKTPEV